MTKTLFISDLHLSAAHPEISTLFFHFLRNCDSSVDALYILGDLFDVWIGDDCRSPAQQDIIDALKVFTARGIPAYFLYGNRDFLIGNRFLQETGITLLPDECVISVYGTPVLLLHGDTLCTDDLAYLKARKYARNRFLQKLFLLLPRHFRQKIAEQMRMKSKQHTQNTAIYIMDAKQQAIEAVMKKHQVIHLIHGHTHQPGIHHFKFAGVTASRMVLGAWHNVGSVLQWQKMGEPQLLDFKLPASSP